MSHGTPIVFVVDDDVSVRESPGIIDPLRRLAAGDIRVRTRVSYPVVRKNSSVINKIQKA